MGMEVGGEPGQKSMILCFPWQRACYWQSRFSGEVAQKPHYSGLKNEWTMTGGNSEDGQLFQEIWEELRKWNRIFHKNNEFNMFLGIERFMSFFSLVKNGSIILCLEICVTILLSLSLWILKHLSSVLCVFFLTFLPLILFPLYYISSVLTPFLHSLSLTTHDARMKNMIILLYLFNIILHFSFIN